MTKADIARIVYERHGGISNREAARLVEIIFETIKRQPRRRREGPDHRLRDLPGPPEARAARTQSPDWRGDGHQAAQLGRLPALEALRARPRERVERKRTRPPMDRSRSPTSCSSRSVRSARSPTPSRTCCATGSRSSRRSRPPRTAPASASTAARTSRPCCASSSCSTRRASRSPARRSGSRPRWAGAARRPRAMASAAGDRGRPSVQPAAPAPAIAAADDTTREVLARGARAAAREY